MTAVRQWHLRFVWPVSYTHLDVYKRQILATANCGGIEITVEFGGKIQYTLKEGSETTAYEE